MDHDLDNIHPVHLWPTSLFLSQLSLDNTAMINELYNLERIDKDISKSNYGGWQSNIRLFENNIFDSLKEKIVSHIHAIFQKDNIEFKQMWGCINRHKDFNTVHSHGNEYHLSGVYYLKVPENSGAIAFRDPRPAAISSSTHSLFGFGDTELFTPVANMLILFPSYLEHFVLPNESKDYRMSISFDIRFGDL